MARVAARGACPATPSSCQAEYRYARSLVCPSTTEIVVCVRRRATVTAWPMGNFRYLNSVLRNGYGDSISNPDAVAGLPDDNQKSEQ
jgi:hypothetical protein